VRRVLASTGIDADVAVRNTNATMHRVSYHITIIGKDCVPAYPLCQKAKRGGVWRSHC
jgi:hypothetical protein